MVSRRRTVKRSRKGSRNGSRKQRGGNYTEKEMERLNLRVNGIIYKLAGDKITIKRREDLTEELKAIRNKLSASINKENMNKDTLAQRIIRKIGEELGRDPNSNNY